MVIPTGYSFNLSGTAIYLTMAAIFIAQATNTPMTLAEEIGLLGILLITSKGAAGVTGSGFIVLAATLSTTGNIPVAGLALILGIDRFMSEARAITNLISNAVATVAVAKWEGAFDEKRARDILSGKKIAQLGKELGLQVPFIRPKVLAQDRTLQLNVIKHSVAALSEKYNMMFDSIMLLQPTSPFRSKESIVKSYDYFCKYNADTLITISDVSKFAPSTKYLAEKSLLPDLFQLELLSEEKQKQKQGTLRQDFEQIWWRNGSIYIFNTATLINSNSLYGGKTIGMPTDSVESINIDTPEDLALAKIIALGLRNL